MSVHPSIKLGRILGIEVAIHPSWLIAFGLVTWSLAQGYFPVTYPGWAAGQYWSVGVAGALLLFASVLLHELSHSFVALARGMGVHSITIFVFGGVSNLQTDADKPGDEFLTAVVGPLTSLGLAVLFAVLHAASAASLPIQVVAVLGYLSLVNLMLGLFNLIPGFPLDGGRVLRSLVWSITRSRRRATSIAAGIGQAVGFAFIAWGILQSVSGNLLGGLWIAFIGWFLNNAAEASIVQVNLEQSFRGVQVAQVMESAPLSVAPDATIDDLVNNYILRHDVRALTVSRGDALLGLITLTDVRRLPREAWTSRRVHEVMTPVDKVLTVHPAEPLDVAFRMVAERDVNQVPAVDNGRVVGLLTRSGILRHLQIRSELGLVAEPRVDSPSEGKAAA